MSPPNVAHELPMSADDLLRRLNLDGPEAVWAVMHAYLAAFYFEPILAIAMEQIRWAEIEPKQVREEVCMALRAVAEMIESKDEPTDDDVRFSIQQSRIGQ